MWETVKPATPAAKAGKGVDVAVTIYGKHKTPVVRIRIWKDVLDQLALEVDSDVSLCLGLDEHAGQLKIEHDRMGAYTLRASRGELRYVQLQASLTGWTERMAARAAEYEIIEDGDGLIVLLGEPPEPSEMSVQAAGKRLLGGGVSPDAPSQVPKSPTGGSGVPRKAQATQNPRPPEDRVAPPPPPPPPVRKEMANVNPVPSTPPPPPPPPPPPKPDADGAEPWWAGLPTWARLAARRSHNTRVPCVLALLAEESGVNLNKVIYAFSPPLKESMADALISETRRALKAVGLELVRSKAGIYTVEKPDADD